MATSESGTELEGAQDEDPETGNAITSDITVLDSYFKDLLDLVPASIFFDAEANQKISAHRNRQDGLSANEVHKRISKKFKFDPEAPTKTSELQKIVPTLSGVAVDADGMLNGSEPKKSHVAHRPNGLSAQSHRVPVTIVNHGDEADSETERETGKIKKKKRKIQSNNSITEKVTPPETESEDKSGETSGSELIQGRPNPDQLREKLRARIAELQSKRQKDMTAEEFMERKRLRRKESKLKLKQKRKEAKKLKQSVEKQKKNSESKMNGVSEVEPGQNNRSNMVFSKFQFSEQARKPKENKQKKPKSYKELYMKVRGCKVFFFKNLLSFQIA